MNLQQIYNATYNYFAEEFVWPQLIMYDPLWEFSQNDNIKNAYIIGKRDGMKRKLKLELEKLETYDKVFEVEKSNSVKNYY